MDEGGDGEGGVIVSVDKEVKVIGCNGVREVWVE